MNQGERRLSPQAAGRMDPEAGGEHHHIEKEDIEKECRQFIVNCKRSNPEEEN